MASEITYAEVRFENASKSLGTKSEPPTGKKLFTVVRTDERKMKRGYYKQSIGGIRCWFSD